MGTFGNTGSWEEDEPTTKSVKLDSSIKEFLGATGAVFEITNMELSKHLREAAWQNPRRSMKKLIIMRGLSGSGKSTLAKSFGGLICSADDYFTSILFGYRFDPKRLPQAHQACRKKAEKAMTKGVECVVIDNTNSMLWEFNHYLYLAEKHGYEVEIRFPQTPWAWDPEECAKRNKHGVPLPVIKAMLERFEHRP